MSINPNSKDFLLAMAFLRDALRSFNEESSGEGENYSSALDAVLLQGQRIRCQEILPSEKDLRLLAVLFGRHLYWEKYFPIKETVPKEQLDSILRRAIGEEFFSVWPSRREQGHSLFRRRLSDDVRAFFS